MEGGLENVDMGGQRGKGGNVKADIDWQRGKAGFANADSTKKYIEKCKSSGLINVITTLVYGCIYQCASTTKYLMIAPEE